MPQALTQIDGSYGEGGGQILRTALTLAVITGQPIEIVNIRAGRSKPGLQPQHLAAVRAAASLCDARLEGNAVGSQELTFKPADAARPGEYRFDIGTAGATTLVAQTVLLPLALAGGESSVTITGGTHVPHSPPAEYLEAVYLPAMRRFGVDAESACDRPGFYPKGGGELRVTIRPTTPGPADLVDRGREREIIAFVRTSNLPEHVADRGAAEIHRFLKGVGRTARIERIESLSPSPGAAVMVAADGVGGFGGFTSLGQRGLLMEKVARRACEELMAWLATGSACDEHLADQLVLPAALAARTGRESRWTTPAVTEHLRTALWVAGRLLSIESSVESIAPGRALVTIRGAR